MNCVVVFDKTVKLVNDNCQNFVQSKDSQRFLPVGHKLRMAHGCDLKRYKKAKMNLQDNNHNLLMVHLMSAITKKM